MKTIEDGLARKSVRESGKRQEENRICSEYIERERNFGNEEVKVSEREKVMDFLAANDPKTNIQRRLLSLPCIHWKFEHEFYKRFNNAKFLGLEWTWGVMELGMPYMPRRDNKRPITEERGTRIGDIGLIKTDIATCLWVSAGSFFSLRRNEVGENKKFANKFRTNTHVWLDFTSQLCVETTGALAGLGSFLNLGVNSVPVAVTLMAARDNHSSNESRVAEIYARLNQRGHRYFDLKKWWSYSHHGIPMLTVCGLMLKGTSAPSPEQLMRMHACELNLSEKEADFLLDGI